MSRLLPKTKQDAHVKRSSCLLEGLLRAVGKELFNTTVDITVVNVDHVGLPSGKQLQHVIFDVKMTDADQDMLIVPSVTVSQGLYDDDEVAEEWPSLISPKIFCNLFPYHILFDDKMRIKQCGVTIQKMSHYKVNPGNDIRYKLIDYLISSLVLFS